MNTNQIGDVIKTRRKSLRITQQELADLAGVGLNTVVAVERNAGNPRLETISSILSTLGLQISVTLKSTET